MAKQDANPGMAAPPASLTKDQVSKLKTGARKAGLGGVDDLLLKLQIPKSQWFEPLRWLMREQGAEIGHQWQIMCAFAGLEQALPIDDAVWLVQSLGEQLAYRGKDSVFHGASLLLPSWDWVIDHIVIRSFAGHVDRLRAAKVHDSYRLGILYARAQLGDEISPAEKAEVLAALARSYATTGGTCSLLIPTDGDFVEHSLDFKEPELETWAAVTGPFASPEAWARAICAAAAANERVASRWERADLQVDRVLRHAEQARPEELGLLIAFGYVDESACSGDRAALAKKYLGGLEAEAKAALQKALDELAELTERVIPKEVSDVLMPGGTAIADEIEALAATCGESCDVRIYVPVRGEASANGIAEVGAEIYGLEGTPEFNGVMMDPLVTLDLAEIPELRERFGCEALAFFISERNSNTAHELESGEVRVMRLSLEQARDLSSGTPFRLMPVDVPSAAFDSDPPEALQALAAKLRALPMRVLGPPAFIQGESRTEGFLLQVSESFIDANFGGGVMYLYDDDGFWQS